MNQLQGISNFCGLPNPSGLIKIEYAPIRWIDPSSFEPILSNAYNWQYNILFTQGGWLKAYVLADKKVWKETQRNTKQGPNYEQQVRAVVPNLRVEVAGELNRMAHERFLLKIEDVAGRLWILGSLETPFDFLNEGTSGESGGLKHHRIRFVSQTIHKAAGFQPIFNL